MQTKKNSPYHLLRPSLAVGETLKKQKEFEVVPLAEVLQKARPLDESEPSENRIPASPSRTARSIKKTNSEVLEKEKSDV